MTWIPFLRPFQLLSFGSWLAPRQIQAVSAGGWAFLFHVCQEQQWGCQYQESLGPLSAGRDEKQAVNPVNPASNQSKRSACLPWPLLHTCWAAPRSLLSSLCCILYPGNIAHITAGVCWYHGWVLGCRELPVVHWAVVKTGCRRNEQNSPPGMALLWKNLMCDCFLKYTCSR